MTPRSLDEARRLAPHLGFALYAIEPGGPVTLEVLDDGHPYAWAAPTEREAWEKAFPPTAAEPLAHHDSFVLADGTAAHAERAFGQIEPPDVEPDPVDLFD